MTKSKTTGVAVVSPEAQAIATMTEAGDITGLKDAAAMASGLQKAAKARGMGVAAENKAAEVVLRAERGIGQVLSHLKAEGLRAKVGRNTRDGVIEPTIAELLGMPSGSTAEANRATSAASRYQQLARMSDEDFERLIASRKAESERIAKVDFYRAAQQYGRVPEKAVKAFRELVRDDSEDESPTFVAFRAAAQALDLSQLAVEELAELAGIINGLVKAYNAEKARRA